MERGRRPDSETLFGSDVARFVNAPETGKGLKIGSRALFGPWNGNGKKKNSEIDTERALGLPESAGLYRTGKKNCYPPVLFLPK